MAEVQSNNSGKSRGRKSTRVDMTAMVDVAFLLLTFFILTTTLTQGKGIFFVVPSNEGPPGPITEDKIMTLILGANDQVYYYHGMPDGDYARTDFSEGGLRTVISSHLNRHPNPCSVDSVQGCWDPIFVIKPQGDSRYKNLVDVVDELQVAGATKYSYGSFGGADSTLWASRRIVK